MNYQPYLDEASRAYTSFRNKSRLVATIRLTYFLVGLITLYFLLIYSWQLILLSALVFFGVFLVLVKWNQRIDQKRNYWKKRIALIHDEQKRMAYDFAEIEAFDTGEAFYDPLHLYLRDLDIFGDKPRRISLFGYLSRAHTAVGRERLASWLLSGASAEEIIKRQEISGELSNQTSLRLDFQTKAHLNQEKKTQIEDLYAWLGDKDVFLSKKWLHVVRLTFTVIAVSLWILTFVGIVNYVLAILFSFINLGIVGRLFQTSKTLYDNVGKNSKLLQKYASLWETIEGESFENVHSKALQEQLKGSSEAAKSLTKLLELFEYRLNAFAFLFLNGLFLWDVQFGFALEKWRKQYGKDVPVWIDTLSDFEALFSLASFKANHTDYAHPIVSKDERFVIKALAHPLLNQAVRVPNDISIQNLQEIALITGSNMAGKSTFLRSLGINMVLACAGAVVCAKEFEFVPMGICTSMRIIDSLEKGESSFFAELKRLKQILGELGADNRTNQNLILLDEILRGTNSKDRYQGSAAVIKQLLKLPAVALIASHDVALSEMEKDFPNQIKNYAFEVENTEEGLVYPYKIKRGVCQNTNAVFLMQKMGIEIE